MGNARESDRGDSETPGFCGLLTEKHQSACKFGANSTLVMKTLASRMMARTTHRRVAHGVLRHRLVGS